MLVAFYPYLDCSPLSGHTGQTDTLVPVRKTAAQLEQSHELPQDSHDTARSPTVCYKVPRTAILDKLVTQQSANLLKMLLMGGNKFHSDPLSTASRLHFAC